MFDSISFRKISVDIYNINDNNNNECVIGLNLLFTGPYTTGEGRKGALAPHPPFSGAKFFFPRKIEKYKISTCELTCETLVYILSKT